MTDRLSEANLTCRESHEFQLLTRTYDDRCFRLESWPQLAVESTRASDGQALTSCLPASLRPVEVLPVSPDAIYNCARSARPPSFDRFLSGRSTRSMHLEPSLPPNWYFLRSRLSTHMTKFAQRATAPQTSSLVPVRQENDRRSGP
jgi:hypothetical protein